MARVPINILLSSNNWMMFRYTERRLLNWLYISTFQWKILQSLSPLWFYEYSWTPWRLWTHWSPDIISGRVTYTNVWNAQFNLYGRTGPISHNFVNLIIMRTLVEECNWSIFQFPCHTPGTHSTGTQRCETMYLGSQNWVCQYSADHGWRVGVRMFDHISLLTNTMEMYM